MMEAVSGDFKVGCPGVHMGLISHWWLGVQGEQLA
jgi:hypothetical protein